ncbi:DUF305 domain-containing protein [Saccharopolyspora taberi]|uniref:DUF305 domain-containing protein n=1 Tax=Saccharopolyspora taberi TaxID=60895 RepID=A0ABN3V471_9PSEU
MRRSTIIGAVLAGGLALAGCSSGEQPSPEPPAPGTPPPATAQAHGEHGGAEHGSAEHSTTDQEFARQFLAQQGQILELAELASEQSTNAQVKQVAGSIQQAQQPELDAVNAWLASTAGQQSGSAPEDTEPGDEADAVLTQQEVQQLSNAQGPAFDQQWAQAMTRLHESVLALARSEMEEGSAKELRSIAERVVSSQQSQLEQLRSLG